MKILENPASNYRISVVLGYYLIHYGVTEAHIDTQTSAHIHSILVFLSLFFSLSLTHTHTHKQNKIIFTHTTNVYCTLIYTHKPCLFHTHTHTHTHTHSSNPMLTYHKTMATVTTVTMDDFSF